MRSRGVRCDVRYVRKREQRQIARATFAEVSEDDKDEGKDHTQGMTDKTEKVIKDDREDKSKEDHQKSATS